MSRKKYPPIHPGEVLRDEFLEPMEVSAYHLANAIGVPVGRITAIIRGRRRVTADTALRLARYFGTTAQLWMNMQASYELQGARAELAKTLKSIEPHEASA